MVDTSTTIGLNQVRAENNCTFVDAAMANKSYQFAAYQANARVKYVYLGKGNRKPLPLCVTNGIRGNFPDPKSVYVSYQPTNDVELIICCTQHQPTNDD